MKQSIRNIIFDLGGVLVDLDSRSCIEAFEQIGARHVATYVREHRTADLFLDIELGHMTQAEFCNEVRRIGRCQAEDTDIVWAWEPVADPNCRREEATLDRPETTLSSLSPEQHQPDALA